MKRFMLMLITVVMALSAYSACFAEQKEIEMVLTIKSDKEVATGLSVYDWYKAEWYTPTGKSMLPSFAPVSGGFRIYMGMMVEIPCCAYVHFDRETHIVTWEIDYIPAGSASLDIFSGMITCVNAEEPFSHVEKISATPDGKTLYWDVKDHYLLIFAIDENGEAEVITRLGIAGADADYLLVKDPETGEFSNLKAVRR